MHINISKDGSKHGRSGGVVMYSTPESVDSSLFYVHSIFGRLRGVNIPRYPLVIF